ncbi:PPE domain-containing protein [Nocardia sp. alder85J]|uniref:PPE domain-containing protein n=1 Tax=Nocardia sp. alder85J TaxID=2862949 RepID=UPI001CD5DA50|nr:PPE domain-containing protein [Nocardia sp. alder85J]MCX4093031.1 PPE domain-containing protein [Nocardia sp. alder85J]
MKPGFTGTVWESRPPEQLARDLVTGAGAAPTAEAGLAWARLSATFAASAVEYERILAAVDAAWRSRASRDVLDRIRALRDWLTEAAASAAANAAHAEAHAAAYEVARLAMPDAGEVEAIHALQQNLEQVGTALGAPMLGTLAQLDGQADAAKAVAARVMRTYEATTEPLATPWEQQAPPVVVPDPEPTAETATPAAPESAAAPMLPGGLAGLGSIDFAPTLTAYRSRNVTRVTTETTVESTATEQVSVPMGSMPVGGAPIAARPQGKQQHFPRAALPGEAAAAAAQLELETGMQAAPAVLGGLDPAASRVPTGSTGIVAAQSDSNASAAEPTDRAGVRRATAGGEAPT